MLRILTAFGTRPEAIKMAPVVKEILKHQSDLICRVCITGQHRQMIEPLLDLFGINPDYDLNIMVENQSLEHITISVLKQLVEIIEKERPDYLVVQGDTTTAMAASLAAFYKKVKIAHVEAGLRTFNKWHPFPEEVNRKIIDSVGDLFFAHTDRAKQNLLAEGIRQEYIEVTGNTVVDALLDIAGREFDPTGTALQRLFSDQRRIILVTAHRRENFDGPLANICSAIAEIAFAHRSDVSFVYPVHLNPNVQKIARSTLENIENVLLIEPLDYLPFVQLMKRSYLILTDSGGIQEEAPSLGKPVLVLRETTERPEAVESGAVEVIGTNRDTVVRKITELMVDKNKYERMSKAVNPFGDGRASQRIVKRLFKEKDKGKKTEV